MEKTYHSLKDFELSYGKNAIERANDFQQYIEQLNDFGCKSYWITSHTGIGSTMAIEGFNEPVIAFISNDYLGMSQREETKQAGIDAIKKYGTGACAAQVIGGYLDIHQQLEKEIASFVGQEEAILFSSGFGANAGILRALLGQNDIALIDPYIHTSAMAGLKGTNIKRIGHNDLEYLEKVLKEVKGQYQTKLVIIDGVYSQDGDLSLLPEIITLCKTYETMLMLDDAHGIGVMGANGRGTAEYYNCLGQIDIITGTFSKSFGCVGGFAAASKKIIQYLKFYADSNVFSAAPTPQVTASILKALEIIKKEPQIRTKLWENTNYLRKRLKEEGFDIGKSVSPIFPIMIRDNKKVYEIAKMLQEKGIFTIGIVYPAVRTKEAKDIKESIINAATHLIETEGFSNLTVTGIMRQAEIEPVQFYNRYDDLNKFIDEYVKKYDYWFSDIVKSQKQSSNDKALYMNILVGLFQSLSENKIMQELLKWELANNNETSQRTAQLRELHTLPLCQKFSNIFSNTLKKRI